MTAIMKYLASSMMSVAGLNSHADKIDARLSRGERRLDLTDAG